MSLTSTVLNKPIKHFRDNNSTLETKEWVTEAFHSKSTFCVQPKKFLGQSFSFINILAPTSRDFGSEFVCLPASLCCNGKSVSKLVEFGRLNASDVLETFHCS